MAASLVHEYNGLVTDVTRSSPVVKKLQSGWQEALIAEYIENGARIYFPELINNALVAQKEETAKQKRGKVCVLSIDGGGMRGIIPAKILAHLEKILQQKTGDASTRLVDFFDIVAGTNVGGLLATMVFSGEDKPLFTAEQTVKFLSENGEKIFKQKTNPEPKKQTVKKGFLRRLFRRKCPSPSPSSDSDTAGRYCPSPGSSDGMEGVFRNMLSTRTLSDALKPVLVPCYDLTTAAPFLFSRAGALESPAWDFRLSDVCRAACSTPGLFPPAHVASVDGTTQCTAVDAGMVMNNPAAAALTHVLHNGQEFPTVRDASDVLLLSLGTGTGGARYRGADVAQWGPCQWARPAADIVLDNVSEMVDHMLALAYASTSPCRENYLRLQAVLPASEAALEMDDASEGNVRKLERLADELLQQNGIEHMGFGGMRALQQTNAQRLDWFADQLIEEHRARTLRSSPTVLLKKRH